MRKQTKLVAVTSAAALLAIGASMTSFAATGWVEEGGEWFFYDKDGTRVEDEWKKSGDNWYWLDSEESGAMALDKLVSDGDYTYYVDTTGAMVSNTWVKVVNEEQDDDDPAEYHYYYMQSNGKAHKTGDTSTTKFKTIDGKRYAFDEDGKMLYGWVNGTSEKLTGDDDWAASESDIYYLGSWDDGAMKTGWQKIYVSDAIEDEDMEHWFYFNSNGKRFYNDTKDADAANYKTKKLNGKRYGFDDRGVMVYQWNVATETNTASPSEWSYFNTPEDGARVTKGWFKVVPPSADSTFTEGITDAGSFDKDGADAEDVNWYYADGDGNLYENAIKKIKGKYYAFNENGKMLNGLVFMSVDPDTGEIVEVFDDGVDSDELDDIMDYDFDGSYAGTNASLYYFGNDADADGSMKTGNVVVSIDGDSHNFLFSKTGGVESRGKGQTGVEKDKYIYQFGKRIKAGTDDKYIMVRAIGDISDDFAYVKKFASKDLRNDADPMDDKNKDNETVKALLGIYNHTYVVNTSGAIIKNKTAAKDGDDWYFYVDGYEVKMYTNNKNLPDSLKGWKEFVTPKLEDEVGDDGETRAVK